MLELLCIVVVYKSTGTSGLCSLLGNINIFLQAANNAEQMCQAEGGCGMKLGQEGKA
jgi:hypothetical protein